MSVSTFKIGKKEYVVLTRKRYEQLTRLRVRGGQIHAQGREDQGGRQPRAPTRIRGLTQRMGLLIGTSSKMNLTSTEATAYLDALRPMLADNPRPPGSIKLKGEDSYRIRVGDYRIIYTIQDDRLIVLVIEVGHRRDIYRRR